MRSRARVVRAAAVVARHVLCEKLDGGAHAGQLAAPVRHQQRRRDGAGAALASGTLVRVLPGWCAGTVTTTLLMPHRRGQLPGVRAAVEFLAQHVARHHGSGPDDARA